ncbi:MAG: PIG-L family deacetylase [Nanoarchaeota archaeon]|nr:PIG-L family deacetylase [Nanoarchaeota archaeon]
MKRCLVIVAHPDDETIWMGGMILKHKNWQWTILSLCRKDDPDRAPKFKKVCDYYGAKGVIGNLDDEVLRPLSVESVVGKIKEFLRDKTYDYIFTHGRNGEYGHLRHKEIHKAVKKMIEDEELKCEKTYYFNYLAGKEKAPHDSSVKIPVPSSLAEESVKLNKKEFSDKFKLITQVYGFRENVFETLSCHNVESFSVR